MAEATAPEAPATPPAPPTAAPAKSKFTAEGICPHCQELKTISHRQWCPKNPNKRQHPSKGKTKPKPATKAPPRPKAAKPAQKPAANAQDAFLNERRAELQAGKKPAAEAEPEPEFEDKPAKKPAYWMTWAAIGVGIAGVLYFIWAVSRAPRGEEPAAKDNAAPEGNSHIPGQGTVHIPGLGA